MGNRQEPVASEDFNLDSNQDTHSQQKQSHCMLPQAPTLQWTANNIHSSDTSPSFPKSYISQPVRSWLRPPFKHP